MESLALTQFIAIGSSSHASFCFRILRFSPFFAGGWTNPVSKASYLSPCIITEEEAVIVKSQRVQDHRIVEVLLYYYHKRKSSEFHLEESFLLVNRSIRRRRKGKGKKKRKFFLGFQALVYASLCQWGVLNWKVMVGSVGLVQLFGCVGGMGHGGLERYWNLKSWRHLISLPHEQAHLSNFSAGMMPVCKFLIFQLFLVLYFVAQRYNILLLIFSLLLGLLLVLRF